MNIFLGHGLEPLRGSFPQRLVNDCNGNPVGVWSLVVSENDSREEEQ